MRFLSGLLLHNFVYKIVALLVATVLWAAVQGSRSEEASLDLPISLIGVPEEIVVVDQSALEVNLRLVGSRAALRKARRELTAYPISLEGLSPGEARFPVITEGLNLPAGAKVAARSPSTIVLKTEPVVRKKVAVRADIVGTPPEGVKLVSVDVSPGKVVLAGARSSIRRLREVLTDRVDVTQMSETTVQEVALAPFAGSLVWRAKEDATPIRVQIRLERRPGPPGPEGPPNAARSPRRRGG